MGPRRLTAVVVAVGVAVGLGVAPAAGAPAHFPFYSRPYTDVLVTDYGIPQRMQPTSLSTWLGWGAPAPVPAPTEYLKYPWAPDILARTTFPGAEPLWQRLSPAEWARAGYPAPRVAAWLPGTLYLKYASSDEIIADYEGAKHTLTYEEWRAAGFPQFLTSEVAYVKLSWGQVIAETYPTEVRPDPRRVPLTFAEWADLGYPTPSERDMFPGDTFCREGTVYPDHPRGGIWYRGFTEHTWVPPEAWPLIGADLDTAPHC